MVLVGTVVLPVAQRPAAQRPAAQRPAAQRFRKRHCYTDDVDAVLRSLEPSLRNLFNALDRKGREMIMLDDWKGFTRGTEVLAPAAAPSVSSARGRRHARYR